MKIRAGFRAALTAALLLFPARPGFALCAMCQATLANSPGAAALIEGLRQGIFLLLVIPLLIVAAVWMRLKRAPDSHDHAAAQQSIQDGEAYS